MTDIEDKIEALAQKARTKLNSEKREVWNALQTHTPELAALMRQFNEVFEVDAIRVDAEQSVEWSRNESGREALERWRNEQ